MTTFDNTDKLLQDVSILKALLDNPQPGLFTWQETVQRLAQRLHRSLEPYAGYAACVAWQPSDIHDHFDVTDQAAAYFLDHNEGHIQSAMIERGHNAIKDLGLMDGLKKKEPE